MSDRSECTATFLPGLPTLVLVTTLTAALVVTVPGGAPAATSPHPSTPPTAAGSAPLSSASPTPVAPTVTERSIPGVAPTAKAALSGPTSLTDPHGDSMRLSAHLRVGDLAEFSTVGVTWAPSSEHVATMVRTRSDTGWSTWVELLADSDGPAPSDGAVKLGTVPLWVRDAHGVEVSVYTETGRPPADLDVSTIDPGESTYDATLARSGGLTAKRGARPTGAGTFPSIPRIITRREWGADSRLVDHCWSPRFGTTFGNVFVHHTVNSNSYRENEAASMVRGILAYHTQSQGWCDIGYNFLVDRFGNAYEGRRGGIRRPVRGAHAGDFNTNSTGISLLGNFETGYAPPKMKRALVGLIAWRMGTAYHGAYGRATIAGQRFKRISGHRDAMSTACPGQHVYDWLPRLRQRVAVRLGDYESRIERRWRGMGAGSSWLGVVKMGERKSGAGHLTTFRHGQMFASDAAVVALADGAILNEQRRRGGVLGQYRYPKSRVRDVGDTAGRFAKFQGGRIWWSRATGAAGLKNGAVLTAYLERRGARGRLGFPTRGVFRTPGGTRANFRGGHITWSRSAQKIAVFYR